MHLTSSHFDEPQAVALPQASTVCVSMHDYKDPQPDPTEPDYFPASSVCVGSLDAKLRAAFFAAAATYPELSSVTFIDAIDDPQMGGTLDCTCKVFSGASETNIVNRCAEDPTVPGSGKGGLQLEMSRTLRERLLVEPALQAEFVQAVNDAIEAP